ncbi:MAG: NADP-dependent oxidoreductase [Fimbriimonadaceae bacterium]
MKAARFHEYGGPEVLVIDDVAIPEPVESEIQIKVAGVGVIPFDWKLMKGYFKAGMAVKFPAVFGHEVSGTVTKLGPGVTGYAVGDTVYGQTRKGAAAEYATLALSASARAPTTLDLADAAGVPVGGMTAWQALFDHGGLVRGQRVLIHGGAGGVGMFAIQLAKWKGARVITTASADNEHFVRELGADEVIDYSKVAFESAVRDVDVVLDTIGADTQTRSLQVLKAGGILVSTVGLVDPAAFAAAGRRTSAFSMQPSTLELDELRGLIEDLKVNVVVTVDLPLGRIREAVEESMSGHARGKIVVRVS